MSQTLKNKRALVTGGSRGIGAAIVRRLASQGVNVAFTYANSTGRATEIVEEVEALGVKAIAIQSDSADASAVVAAVDRTVSELGGIDILVNDAGVLALGPIDDFKLEDFDNTIAINVRAVFVATQATVKHMKDGGRIINIGSCNAERIPFQGGAVYAMSKSALHGLQSMADSTLRVYSIYKQPLPPSLTSIFIDDSGCMSLPIALKAGVNQSTITA